MRPLFRGINKRYAGRLTIEAQNLTLAPGEVAGLPIHGSHDFVASTVRDTDVGMFADVIEKAFDPFFTTKPIG